MDAVKKHGVSILPIDSEHSAIFQCLQGNKTKNIDRIILTASGGFSEIKYEPELTNVTIEDALAHPNWSMEQK